MKIAVLLGALGALPAFASAAIQYAPVVTVVGNGTVSTSGTGYTVTIATYLPGTAGQVSPQGSFAFNSSASGTRLVNSVSATSEGALTNNPGVSNAAALGAVYAGNVYTYSAGYDAAEGTAAVNGATANANRSLGRASLNYLSVTGATVLQTQATAYNANNIRGATGSDADTSPALYSSGTAGTAANGGWRNFSTNTLLSGSVTNVRTVELLSGGLFGTAASGTRGLYSIDPTGVAAPTLIIGTGAASSPYEFAAFNDSSIAFSLNGYNTFYIADDSSVANGGGIQKWTYNGSVWTKVYTLFDGTTTFRGLAGQYDADAGKFVLFASSSDGLKLEQVTDTGAGATFTTLATAPTSNAFRGVALTIPTPGSAALLTLGSLVAIRRRRN